MAAFSTAAKLEKILKDHTVDPYTQLPRGVFIAVSSHATLFEGCAGLDQVPANKDELSTAEPVSMDSIFELWSCTKLCATIACLQLVERGKLSLDDDARQYAPELRDVKMFKGYHPERDKPVLESVDYEITVRQLLLHTAGFSYGDDPDAYPGYERHVSEELGYKQLTDPFISYGIDELKEFPLLFKPGEKWDYGWSNDWLTVVIERVSDQSIEEYVQEHILRPLNIKDMTWKLRDDKVNVAMMDEQHRPDVPNTYVPAMSLTQKHHFGGAGLSGSARSYAKILQMLLQGGQLKGHDRILSQESVDAMFTDQLSEQQRQGVVAFPIDAQNGFVSTDHKEDVGQSWGIGGLLVGKGSEGPNRRSAGSLTWDGICTCYWLCDRKKDVAFCFFVNAFPWKARKVLDCLAQLETALYQGLGE